MADQIAVLTRLYEQVKTNLHTLSYEAQSQIIHLLVQKITLHKAQDTAEVELNLPEFQTVAALTASGPPGTAEALRDRRLDDGHTITPSIVFRVPLADLTVRRQELAHRNRWANKRSVITVVRAAVNRDGA